MTKRPHDWSALGLPGDPVPGTVALVHRTTAALDRAARRTSHLRGLLSRIDEIADGAEAAGRGKHAPRAAGIRPPDQTVEFTETVGTVLGTARTAVEAYASELESCQRTADGLLQAARTSGLSPQHPRVRSWARHAESMGRRAAQAEAAALATLGGVSASGTSGPPPGAPDGGD